jgi:hypothetical protein
MTDIVERLRAWAAEPNTDRYLLTQAGDEIERLRACLLRIAQGTNEKWTHDWALRAIETSDLFEQPTQEPKP